MRFREHIGVVRRPRWMTCWTIALLKLFFWQGSASAGMIFVIEHVVQFDSSFHRDCRFTDGDSSGAIQAQNHIIDPVPTEPSPVHQVGLAEPVETGAGSSSSNNNLRTSAPQGQIDSAGKLPQPELVGRLNRDSLEVTPAAPNFELLRPPRAPHDGCVS